MRFLTLKNFLNLHLGLVIIALAVIPVYGPYHWTILCIAAVGILILIGQAHLQSKDDREIVRLLKEFTPHALSAELPGKLASSEADQKVIFDGEIYRIFSYPRTGLDFEMFKKARRAGGAIGDPVVDCDVLACFYIVNRSAETSYMRSIFGSVEVDGIRKTMERQDDFRLQHAFAGSVEYGWDLNPGDASKDPAPLKPLASAWPYEMQSQKPVDGWVRFLLRDINPDKINSNTWQFAVVDSLDRHHPITKTNDSKKDGEIALRRA